MKKFSIILFAFCICLLPVSAHCTDTVARSPLCDKAVALLGDSMTWIGGDSCDVARGWSTYFKRLTRPASLKVYARSGATWTNSPSTRIDTRSYSDVLHPDNVLYNQALRLREDAEAGRTPVPDVIVLYAGANDAWFGGRFPEMFPGKPLPDGEPEPSQVRSLAGSIRLVARMLARSFPEARLVFVTPAEMTKTSAENLTRVADTIDSVASALGYTVLRVDRDVDIRRDTEMKKFTLTSDGVHTNPAGARLLGEYIAGKIIKIYCNSLQR